MEREGVLERLVALHAQRVAEEQAGRVRWLTPEYQIPRFGQGVAGQAEVELEDRVAEGGGLPADVPARLPWPATAVEQLAAVTAAFEGADAGLVRRHLETLELIGEV